MGLIFENFKMALSSIKANKMRAFLTMLGIIIGISSVITITSVGSSVQNSMRGYLSSFGKNRLIVYIGFSKMADAKDSDSFSLDDIEYIKSAMGNTISYIAPLSMGGSKEITNGRKKEKLSLTSVDYGYLESLSSYKLIHGRSLTKSDVSGRKNLIVVDKTFAKKLFGTENVVGKQINTDLNDMQKTFTIVGVYTKETSIFDGLSGSDATEGFIPFTLTTKDSDGLDIMLSSESDLKKETEKVKKFLAKYKNVADDFYTVQSLEDQAGQINSMTGMLSMGLGAIAAISLLVGGIGIMNIMLVSVTERTKEIGIRKSLGARRKDILLQFMVESAILSLAGGVIGIVLGLGLSNVLGGVMSLKMVLDPSSIIIAVVFSLAVGVFFGLYPAYKAAKLDPIDALRYE